MGKRKGSAEAVAGGAADDGGSSAEDCGAKGGSEEAEDADDLRRAYVSRLPLSWADTDVKRCFEEASLGPVEEARVCYGVEDESRGFAFVTFESEAAKRKAVQVGVLKGTLQGAADRYDRADPDKRRTYALKIVGVRRGKADDTVCWLFTRGICPHGAACKFDHPEGQGGCLPPATKRPQKCLAFAKRGRCAKGDECPFTHFEKKANADDDDDARPAEEPKAKKKKTTKKKDDEGNCFNWEKKGKCRRGDECPFVHADQAQLTKKVAA